MTGGVALSLNWTVFDGGARRSRLEQAEAHIREAEARVSAASDQIEDQVWTAYSNLNTAFRQREAATALLTAATQSYSAALESYNYGVRNLLDVTNAQKVLAASALDRHSGAHSGAGGARGSGVPHRRCDSTERQKDSTMMDPFRRLSRLWLFLALMSCMSCSRAPSFEILGSFFPAWLICVALGLLLTVAARWLLLRARVVLALPVLTYPSLTRAVHFRALAGLFSVVRKSNGAQQQYQHRNLDRPHSERPIVTGAIVLGLVVVHQTDFYPRTDDSEILANFIGIAPQVEGPLVRLNVHDNQFVRKGDLLFEIDDRPYQYTLEKSNFRAGNPRRTDFRRAQKNCRSGECRVGFSGQYPQHGSRCEPMGGGCRAGNGRGCERRAGR